MARRYPPGMVAVAHRGQVGWDLFRYAGSAVLPLGSRIEGCRGGDLGRQRNELVRGAFSVAGCAWVCFIDTDQVVPEDIVIQLLDTGYPIVSAVILQRVYPFATCAYSSAEPLVQLRRKDIPMDGFLKLAMCGTGCLLVHKEVFDAVGDPWFRVGVYSPELGQEDIDFTLRAGICGYTPMLACAIRVGHRIEGTIWPGVNGQPWIQWDGAEDVRHPVHSPEPD